LLFPLYFLSKKCVSLSSRNVADYLFFKVYSKDRKYAVVESFRDITTKVNLLNLQHLMAGLW